MHTCPAPCRTRSTSVVEVLADALLVVVLRESPGREFRQARLDTVRDQSVYVVTGPKTPANEPDGGRR